MSRLDSETKRKLREMGVPSLIDALDAQDETLTLGMVFEERVRLAVDDAHATFSHETAPSTTPATPSPLDKTHRGTPRWTGACHRGLA